VPLCFEDAGYTDGLQAVFSALASLEGRIGNTGQSVHHERTALRYTYVIGDPENCAISHFNLATYLMRTSAPPETALAHRLAAALIELQTSSGGLAMTWMRSRAILPVSLQLRRFPATSTISANRRAGGGRPLPRTFRPPSQGERSHGDEALQRVLALVEEIRKKQNS